MGGPGSGSGYRWNSRSTVEGSRSFDVRDWARSGYIPGPSSFHSYWTRDGEEVARIGVRVTGQYEVILTYRSRSHGEEWEDVKQTIPLDWTDCHFGGERPWFICNVNCGGVHCGRRVAKLYSGGKLFACRHCYNLAYQSQHEPPYGRELLKTQNIRMKLGGSASLADPFPDKPKGMHWKTYGRLCGEAGEAEIASWIGVAERFGIEF